MSTSFNVPVPFVGVGTGRCGSHTLCEILSACRNVECLHEVSQISWYQGGPDEQLGKLIRRLRESRAGGKIAGEVGPCLLPQIPHLRSAFRGLKVICMHRPRHEVVRSFLEYGNIIPPLTPRQKMNWADGCLDKNRLDAKIPQCFPTIDGATRQQSIGFYWEMYEALMRKVDQPVFHMHTQQLNDPETVKKLFDFLEIPECDRVVTEVKHSWSMEECQDRRRKARMEHLYA